MCQYMVHLTDIGNSYEEYSRKAQRLLRDYKPASPYLTIHQSIRYRILSRLFTRFDNFEFFVEKFIAENACREFFNGFFQHITRYKILDHHLDAQR